MGGFTVLPDMTVDEAMKTDFTGTILIGGKSWRSENAKQVVPLITYALRQNVVVGGICDASVFLGTTGALNSVAHTSNQLADLQDYAGAAYTGAERYQNIQAVRDGNIITANGTAALEFAKEALLALGTMTEQEADQWYALYKLGWYTAMKGEKKQTVYTVCFYFYFCRVLAKLSLRVTMRLNRPSSRSLT